MQINYSVWIALLTFAVLTSTSHGGSAPTPTSTTPPIATSLTPPPAETVDASANSTGLRVASDIDHAKPNGRMHIVAVGGSATSGDGAAPLICCTTGPVPEIL